MKSRIATLVLLSACALSATVTAAEHGKGKARGKPQKVEATLPAADTAQQEAATAALLGDYHCEFNQQVSVTANAKYESYIDVAFGKQRWTMKPVMSSTGALRLEDVKGQTVMIQIAYKSMLMDVKAGRRLVDECVHAQQAEAKRAAEGQPAPSMMGK